MEKGEEKGGGRGGGEGVNDHASTHRPHPTHRIPPHTHMHARREEAARRAQLDAEAARRKRLEVLKQIQGAFLLRVGLQ